MKNYDIATRTIHAGQEPDPSTGAIMTPIYATSTYVQESPGKHKGFDYSRSINPTRLAYEKCIADLESGIRGWAFASGLAAMATALDALESGSHVVASDDLYGGTFRLFEKVRRRSANLDFTFVDLTDATKFEKSIKPNTRMVWIETPSNPLLKIIDIEAIAKIAREISPLSRAKKPSAARSRAPANARVRGNRHNHLENGPRRNAALSREHSFVCPGRKFGRGREPNRSSRYHDPRVDSERSAREAWNHRFAGAFVGRGGRRARFNRRSAIRFRRDLGGTRSPSVDLRGAHAPRMLSLATRQRLLFVGSGGFR